MPTFEPEIFQVVDPSRTLLTVGAPNVRFSREIHQGYTGEDVLGHKRALSRARPDLYEWGNFTPVAGEFFMDAVVKYKRAHKFGSTRVLGGVMHESLERQHRKGHPTEWAFDALAIKQCQDYWDKVHTTPEQRSRTATCQAGFYWYGHRMQTAYSQWRPFWVGRPPGYASRLDCSGFYTDCRYAGGSSNPNNRGWDGEGYTGTMMITGVRVGSINDLLPGDAIFYGHSVSKPGFNAGDPTHVALYVGVIDNQHMVLSMGSYPMSYVPYNYRHDINHYRHYNNFV